MMNKILRLSTRSYSSVMEGIIVSRRNDKAILQFNRPKKLNAMSIETQINFALYLREFENDPSVKAVIIKGNEAGLSAGADIIQLIEQITSKDDFFGKYGTTFYRGLLRLSEFKKPVISLADKICMGGGAAATFLSSHPVVTERTLFAMPEVFIGFYPNVGANYFLVQLPNNYGLWVGLTGARFIGSDIVNLGLTKNFVKSCDLDRLEEALINLKDPDFNSVSQTISQFQQECPQWNINTEKVKDIFSGSSLEEIIDNLQNDGTEFSTKILQLFSTLSPTSLKATFNLFRESQQRRYNMNEALSADYSLFKNFYGKMGPNVNDFMEGIKSVLVDKKHKPNWVPKTLSEVDDKELIRYFTTNVTDIRASSSPQSAKL